MPRRSIVTLTLAVLVVLLAALAPGTAWVRHAAMQRVETEVANLGLDLDYGATHGNLWTGIEIEDLALRQGASAVAVAKADLRWNLVQALSGSIPVWIDLISVDANLDLQTAPAAFAGTAPNLPFAIQSLQVSDLRLGTSSAEWNLDSLGISGVTITGDAEAWNLSGDLTAEGLSIPFTADIRPNAPSARVEVSEGDARILQTFWPPLEEGLWSGILDWSPNEGVVAEARLRNVRASIPTEREPIAVEGASGTLAFRANAGTFTAEASAFGGRNRIEGAFDLAESTWEAVIEGNADLKPVADWLGLEVTDSAEGDVAFAFRGSGWDTWRIEGQASGDGLIDGRPAQVDLTTITLDDTGSLGLDGRGQLLGGQLVIRSGERLRVAVEGASWGPLSDLSVAASVERRLPLRGTAEASGSVAGGPLQGSFGAAVDLTPLGLRGTVDGNLAGSMLDGFLVSEEGRVDARLQLSTQASSQHELDVTARGSWSDLELALSLSGATPLIPNWQGALVDADLRGTATGRITNLETLAIEGEFGPISLSGILPLTMENASSALAFQVDETSVRSGTLSALVGVREGLIQAGVDPITSSRQWTISAPGLSAVANDASVVVNIADFELPILETSLGRVDGELQGRIEWNPASSWSASGRWNPRNAIVGLEPVVLERIELGPNPRADVRRGPLSIRWSEEGTTVELRQDDLGRVWPTLEGWQGEGDFFTTSTLPSTPLSDIDWFGRLSISNEAYGAGNLTLDGDVWLLRAEAPTFPADLEAEVLWSGVPSISGSMNLPGNVNARLDLSASQREVLQAATWSGSIDVVFADAPGYGVANSPLELSFVNNALLISALDAESIELRADGARGQIALPLRIANENERGILALRGPWSSPAFEITTTGLTATGQLASGQLDAVRVQGDGRTLQGVTLIPGPEGLGWSRAGGWDGSADLTIESNPSSIFGEAANVDRNLSAQLNGEDSNLRITSEVAADPTNWGIAVDIDALVQGEPWSLAWSGAAEVTAYVDDPSQNRLLAATTSLALSGEGLLPSLSGTGSLRGSLEGNLTVRSDDLEATVELDGTHANLIGVVSTTGWQLNGSISETDLSPWIGGMPDVRLSAEPSLSGDWTGDLQGTLGDVRVHTRMGDWSGTGMITETISLRGRAELDLAALSESVIAGGLAGPVDILAPRNDFAAATLSAQLTMRDVQALSSDWQGRLDLSGLWNAPDVQASLTARGNWSGTLQLERAPSRGVWSIASTLAGVAPLGEFVSDLRAEGRPDSTRADGFLRIASTQLDASGTEQGTLLLRDAQGEDGTHLEVAQLLTQQPSLVGQVLVESFVPAISASIDLSARWPNAGEPWLDAEVSPITGFGVTFPAQRITITSARLLATLSESEDGRWELSRRDGLWEANATSIPLGGIADGFRLAEANGASVQQRSDATINLETPAGPVQIAWLSQAADVAFEINSALREGAVEGRIVRANGTWSGTLAGNGVLVPLLGNVTASAQARGSDTWPAILASVQLDGPADAMAQLALSPEREGWTATADATLLQSSAEPIAVSGRVWPNLDVSIQTPRSDARLSANSWARASTARLEGTLERNQQGVIARLAPQPNGELELRAFALASPDSGLRLSLPPGSLQTLVEQIRNEGVTAEGFGRLDGLLQIDRLGARISERLTWRAPFGGVTIEGSWLEGRASLEGSVQADVSPDATLAARLLSGLTGDDGLRWVLTGSLEQANLAFAPRTADLDRLQGNASLQTDPLLITLDAQAAGSVLNLRADAGEGLSGAWTLGELAFSLPGELPTVVEGDIAFEGSQLRVNVRASGPGRASLDGVLDVQQLLPVALRPDTEGVTTNASARVSGFELAAIPWIAREAPYLSGTLNGLAELRGTRVLSQLSIPDLTTAGREVALRLDAAGDLSPDAEGVSFVGRWGGDPIQGSVDRDAVSVLLTMTKFPLTAPLEARFGELATEGSATGVLRAEYAWNDDQRRFVRLATEQVTLERDGVVNEGILSASLTPVSAQLSAQLVSEGSIDLDATLSPSLLNLQTTIEDASLTPLLGLIPALQDLDAQAAGTLRGEISGALDALEGRIDGANLDVSLAGVQYQIIDGAGVADRDTVQFSGQVQGTFPVGGVASVRGEVRLQEGIQPLRDGFIEIQGDLELPLVGALQAAQGVVRLRGGEPPFITIDGVLGGPVRFEGTVWPFDVRASGPNVTISIPGAFIETATGPADVRLYYDDMLVLTGSFAARDGILTLERGPAGDGDPAASSWWRRLRYDDLKLTAERMNVDTSFAEGALTVDLALGGVASAPTLNGVATVTRGTLNLSGREFRIREGALRFDPTRGVYPRVQLDAITTYDKQEVLAGASIEAAFPQPEGPSFDVTLSMDAVATPATEAGTGFELDVDPVLASEALLALPATESRPAVLRPLTAAELTSLVTLRQLDISGTVLGGNAAGGVASSAIDTAVQGVLLREVQDAFAQALGLDVVEIRTPSISSVLRGEDDTFGVAVRLGAYVSEGVFASYEIGRTSESTTATGIRNELAVSYQVGPIAFDVATRLDVGADPMEANNRLEASLQYVLTPFAAIEAGASVGSNEGEARFGVTLRW